MTTTYRTSQNFRDQNARQLRSDFLASMFTALCNKIHETLTRSVVC